MGHGGATSQTHHDAFAHEFLPRLVHSGAAGVINAFGSPTDGAETLREAWESVGSRLPGPARVAPEGLSAGLYRLEEEALILLLRLPEPQEAPRVRFVAIVAILRCDGNGQYHAHAPRVLTLEDAPAAGEEAARLREWNGEGFDERGTVFEQSEDEFVSALTELIADDLVPA
jgi:hypothetical protein